MKGKSEAIEIYDLLGRAGEVTPELARFAERYERALGLFRERRFDETRVALDELAVGRADDLSIRRLISRAQALLDNPPPEDWDAVSRFEVK